MEPPASKFDRFLKIAAVCAVIVLLSCSSWRRIWCADFWWQHETGRLVAEQGIPHQDVFSFSAGGNRWIELRWIYCYLLYQSTQLLGFGAAVLFKWLAILATFAFAVFATADRKGVIGACVVLFVAILASSQRFFVRPELVSYLMLAAYLWILQRHRAGRGRLIYVLPILQVLWTNSHTMFMLGPLVVGLLVGINVLELFLSRRRDDPERTVRMSSLKRVAIVFVATVLACLVNPYGIEGFLHPFQLFREIHSGVFKEHISEFWSPFAFAHTRTALLYYDALIVLVVGSCLINLKKLNPFLTLLCVSQFYLSATSIRNLPLFCVSAVAMIIWNLQHSNIWNAEVLMTLRCRLARILAVLLIVACVGYSWALASDRFNVRQHDTNQFGIGIAQHRYPREAVDFMHEHDLAGPLFATIRDGSYLLAHGYQVFIDPRLEVYGEVLFSDYIRMQEDRSAWQHGVRQYGFNAAMVGLQSGAIKFLRSDRAWTLVYFDENVAIFLPDATSPAVDPLITAGDFDSVVARLRARLPAPRAPAGLGLFERVVSPAPYLRLGKFLLSCEMLDQSEFFLRTVASSYPQTPGASTNYAILLDKQGDVQGAVRHYEKAIEQEPNNASLYFRLGQLYFSLQRMDRARVRLQRSLELDSDNALAWAILTKIHVTLDDSQAALSCIRRALDLDPTNATYLKNLAKIHMLRREYAQTIDVGNQLIELQMADQAMFVISAAAHIAEGDVRAAREIVERGLQRYPDDQELLSMLEQVDERIRRTDDPS